MPGRDSAEELRIGIGDIVFLMVSQDMRLRLMPEAHHRKFATNADADVILASHYGYPKDKNTGRKVFDSGGLWSFFQSKEELVFRFYSSASSFADRKLVLKPNFKSGNIYIRKTSIPLPDSPITIFPFKYPLDELLMINLLSLGRGVITHACGIRSGGQGLLFSGPSGAGKSTMANLWHSEKDVDILNDDRVIIRKINHRFWMYGTPWHGEGALYSSGKTPLEKIFFIRHRKANSVKSLAPIEATSRLITYCFPTFWSKAGMEFTLKFCAELAQKIPCYELGFVPDKSALDFIRGKT